LFGHIVDVWHGPVKTLSSAMPSSVERIDARVVEPEAADPLPGAEVASGLREKSVPFRAYLLWLTFPPMILLFQGQPFRLVIIYGALGAAFMPFLALTLVWLLNSSRTPREWRNGYLSNSMLVIAGLLFLVLCAKQIIDQPWSDFF
jgi:hypothetical protein